MSKKCTGCGALFQSSNIDLEGYIAEENYEKSSICERCFRINNYGEYKAVVKDNSTFIDILKGIPKNDLVVLVLDLFNLPSNLDLIKDNISNNILLVLTKRDVLPKVIYEERLLDYVDNYNLNTIDRIVVSSLKNYNFDDLMFKINTIKTSDRVYVIGFTNAGKSTLINKLIYNYDGTKPIITTSMLSSTTLNSIEIKLSEKLTLIDTPGLLEEGSIEGVVSFKMLKNITPKREIKPITYQVKSKQFIIVEDFLKIELANNNITMFLSNTLKIDRYYKDRSVENLVNHNIFIDRNEDLVISGLGFIKFTKKENIIVSLPVGVKVYTRKSLV